MKSNSSLVTRHSQLLAWWIKERQLDHFGIERTAVAVDVQFDRDDTARCGEARLKVAERQVAFHCRRPDAAGGVADLFAIGAQRNDRAPGRNGNGTVSPSAWCWRINALWSISRPTSLIVEPRSFSASKAP